MIHEALASTGFATDKSRYDQIWRNAQANISDAERLSKYSMEAVFLVRDAGIYTDGLSSPNSMI
jgi:hypothetical protein